VISKRSDYLQLSVKMPLCLIKPPQHEEIAGMEVEFHTPFISADYGLAAHETM
jgi:hypothetical protein